jgi:hypothetical protein
MAPSAELLPPAPVAADSASKPEESKPKPKVVRILAYTSAIAVEHRCNARVTPSGGDSLRFLQLSLEGPSTNPRFHERPENTFVLARDDVQSLKVVESHPVRSAALVAFGVALVVGAFVLREGFHFMGD